MLKRIYRIEHIDSGFGCYNHTYVSDDVRAMKSRHCYDSRKHPNPYNDDTWDKPFGVIEEELIRDGKIRFGFTSFQQLLKWFNADEIGMLYANGFRVVRRIVNVINESCFQCVYEVD